MVEQALVDRVRRLDVPERLELIGQLWDTIDADALPVTSEVAALIDERLVAADTKPLHGRSWDEVEADLRKLVR